MAASSINKSRYSEQDTRLNLYELDTPEGKKIQDQAAGVACLIHFKLLHKVGDNYHLQNPHTHQGPPTLKKVLEKKYSSIVDEKEKFQDEPSVGSGTAFLISKKLALSAAHCVSKKNKIDQDKVKALQIVFNFVMKDSQTANRIFAEKEVYRIEDVLLYENKRVDKEKIDWVLLKLDREVEDITPLNLAEPNHFKCEENQHLSMLGYPMGLPLKFTSPGIIQKVKKYSFECQIDAFEGNSGSPLFFEGKVVGILYAGNKDYEDKDYTISAAKPSTQEIQKK